MSSELEVEIRRSERRRKTISARREGDRLIVYLPTGLTPRQEQDWVERMRRRVALGEQRQRLNSDGELATRAEQLNQRYFDGALRPKSVTFVTNQNTRFASCSPTSGAIRLSHRLAEMPTWVLDYVLVHELAHLQIPNHSARFWRLVKRYPLTERARGFLIAKGMEGEDDDNPGEEDCVTPQPPSLSELPLFSGEEGQP